MHPAGGPEFAHAGVDDGVTGFSALPGFLKGGIFAPREVFKFWTERFGGRLGKMMEQVISKLAPAEFGGKLAGWT